MAAATWFSPTASSAASRVLSEGRAVDRLFSVALEFTRRTLPNQPDRRAADTTVPDRPPRTTGRLDQATVLAGPPPANASRRRYSDWLSSLDTCICEMPLRAVISDWVRDSRHGADEVDAQPSARRGAASLLDANVTARQIVTRES
ncbi:uncharacterized protein PO1_contig-036-37 [Mycobacterium sp. PO1]|nr:uncharacterized protein PO1_contig-036-37 [Mycobacterium sp. PO1]GFM24733.1 uncharacterized protein PO2_contig-047-37 [Mycobacterium sp. PO2]